MRRRLLITALSAFGASLALTAAVPATAETVKVHLRGFEEVPSVSTGASGELRLKINDKAGTIDYELDYENLEGDVTQAHIHFGQKGVAGGISLWLCKTTQGNAPPQTPVCPGPRSGYIEGTLTAANVVGPAVQLIDPGQMDEVIRAIRAGAAYGNVHSVAVGSGELRGQLH